MASISPEVPLNPADSVAAVHQRLLHEPGFQFDFGAPLGQIQPPGWLASLLKYLAGLRSIFEILFWSGVAIFAAIVLYFLIREVLRYRRRETAVAEIPQDPGANWRPSPARASALLADADRLAGQQNFAEAVHVLLFRSIEDIDERHPRMLQPSLTSRDIAGIEVLPASARSAFARIAAVVERGLFGGGEIGAADFMTCRRAYEEFAFPDHWRARDAEYDRALSAA